MISVFWKSRRQTLVSLSTAECELIAACEGVVLAQSVQALAEELLGETLGLVLRVDNVAAIILAEGGGSQRTRHLRVRANFLKEMIENNSLQVRHCPGELQLADALTKALPAPRLEHLNRLLGISVPSLDAPSVQAIAATSRTFGNLEVASEGQGLILVILLMMQLQPAASQEDEERDPIDIDLYIVAVMMACSVLFVWELGKHCLRQCTRDTEAQVASLRPTEEESRRSRRQETIRRALEREAGEGLRPRRGSQGTHDDDEDLPVATSGGAPASSQVHVHVTTPPVSETRASEASSSSRQSRLHQPTWTLVRPPTPPIPEPPPYPPGETEGVQGRVIVQRSREIGVQTDGPQGLSDVQLCEMEVITSSARTPGVIHLFPECHVLRTVSNTHRRTFCRYCLMTLRQRGTLR